MELLDFPDDIGFLIVDWMPEIVSPSAPALAPGSLKFPFCKRVVSSGKLGTFESARAFHDGSPVTLSDFKKAVLEEADPSPERDLLIRSLDRWAASRAAP